jgi:hypothetical protein
MAIKSGFELIEEIQSELDALPGEYAGRILAIERERDARIAQLKTALEVLWAKMGPVGDVPIKQIPPKDEFVKAAAMGFSEIAGKEEKLNWIADKLFGRGFTEKEMQKKLSELGESLSVHTFFYKKRLAGTWHTALVSDEKEAIGHWFKTSWTEVEGASRKILPKYLPESFLGKEYTWKGSDTK